MYNNYLDLVDDIVNENSEKEFKKQSRGRKNVNVEPIQINIPKPVVKNNLDFDFSEYEQVIKSLESEIEKERTKNEDRY